MICTSYLAYSQIWLNLSMDDTFVISSYGCIAKFQFKKHSTRTVLFWVKFPIFRPEKYDFNMQKGFM
jgi:hypothetical protein